jgi:gliding motility-associated-like protein
MKKSRGSFLFVVFTTLWFVFATSPIVTKACSFDDSFPYSTITPTSTYQVINLVYSGERYQFTAAQNLVYVFSYCEGGGSNNVDTQIQIFDLSGNSYAFNDDFCSLGSEVTWVCPTSGTYVVVTYEYNCNAYNTNAGNLAYKVMPAPTDQDCLGAIPLCFDNYYTSTSYSGTGNYPGEISTSGSCPTNCLLSGEKNDVWYTFTAQTNGTVAFLIDPNNNSDDYDWAVYNLTNHNCEDIYSVPSIMVSCNYSADDGATGPNGGSSITCGSASAGAYNAAIPVSAGQTYVVNVSNYSSTNYGYEIDFGNSTAQIVDNSEPFLQNIVYAPVCGQNNITVQFSENVLCASLAANDFNVSGPNGNYTVADVSSPSCAAGGSYDDIFTLEMADILVDGGTYTVSLNTANGIEDVCYNQAVAMGNLTFSFVGLTASASVFQGVTCFGDNDGEASATVSGGTSPYFYEWTSGETTDFAYSLEGGAQYVTISDFYGCEDVISVSIPEPQQIIVNAGADQSVCNGQSVVLGGSPTIQYGVAPLTYGWSPTTGLDNSSALNPTASPTVATTYTITVEDNNGCTASDAVAVGIYPAATVDLGPDVTVCSASLPLMLDAGAGYTNYDWSENAYDGNQTMPVSVAGTYSVTVTNSNNCTATDMIVVGVSQNPLVNIGDDGVVCSYDLPLELNAGQGFSDYDWTGTAFDGSQIFEVTTTGAYGVTVTDASGCTGSDNISIDVNPDINIVLQPTNPLCHGAASGAINAVVSGGTPDYSYWWSNSQSTQSISHLLAGTYSVVVTDNSQCTATAEITLVDPEELLATVTTVATECGELIGSASVVASGGAGGYSYLWNTTATTPDISSLAPGTYVCTVTDLNDCSITVEAEVGFYGEGDVQISQLQEVLCFGNATGVLQGAMVDGTSPFTYHWSNNATANTINNLIAGDYSITITDVYGCSGSAQHTILQPPALVLNADIEDVMCRGGDDGEITLFVEGGVDPYLYTWSNGSPSSHISGLISGAYSVTIQDLNGCQLTNVYTVVQPDKLLELELLVQDVPCYNQPTGAALAQADGGTPPFTTMWYQNGTLIATGAEINSLSAGNYSVVVRDTNQCEAVSYFTISQPNELELDYSVTGATCQGNDDGSAIVYAEGGTYPYQYEWTTGEITDLVEFLTSGQYVVTVTDANLCVETISVFVPESSRLCLRIPNAFTPNGDGVNDTWDIEYIEKYPSAEVYVFNRWGQKLYAGRPGDASWDGYINGNKAPAGSYTYIVDLRNGLDPFTGVVVVVH